MNCSKCGCELQNNHCTNPYCTNILNGYNNDIIKKDKIKKSFFKEDDISLYSNNINNFYSEETEVIDFFGTNSNYYFDKWIKYKLNPKFISFNIPSYFLNFFWFLYRKLYVQAFFLVFTEAFLFLLFDEKVIFIFPILFIFVSLISNQIYVKHVLRNIGNIKSSYRDIDPSELRFLLKSTGGTTFVVPILTYLLIIFIIFIFILNKIAN